jgi:hypothetical protein
LVWPIGDCQASSSGPILTPGSQASGESAHQIKG